MQESDESRERPRRRTLLGGRIFFDDNPKVYDCGIRDLSRTGVRIQADLPVAIEVGTMVNVSVDRVPGLHRSEVMWIRGEKIGLRFLAEIRKVPASVEALFGK